jgi:pSer/pThr/pTyr-binding forkhead associated (FHA) protein
MERKSPNALGHKESPQMPDAQLTAGRALLLVHSGEASHAIQPGRSVVTIGRAPQADVQIDDPRISPVHLRVEPASVDGQWRIVDSSQSGMFVDGLRKSSVMVTEKTIVRLGDPTAGKALTFDVIRPSRSQEQPHPPP